MKTSRVPLVLLFGVGIIAQAQEPTWAAVTQPKTPAPTVAARRSAEELEQLLAPIALYPDALIAIILPASTATTDIVLAARYVRDFPNDKSQIENRDWDDSVKSLANYPEVLKWMDENLQWTKQVGEAFAVQSADVMQAIQRLRAKARTAGTLADTPQQQIIAEPQVIRIVPAQPDVIYVPRYEPEVVFVDRPVYISQPFVSHPFLTFGAGVRVGSWLAFECDWGRNVIWVGNRHRRWHGHDWRRPVVPIAPPVVVNRTFTPEVRQWRPPPQARPPYSVAWSTLNQPAPVTRPTPLGSTFKRSHAPHGSVADGRRETSSLPFVRPLPRSAPSGLAAEPPGPRAPVTNVVRATPALPVARTPAPTPAPVGPPSPAPASVVTAPPATRRSNPDWARDRETRSRPHQNHGASMATLPVVPTLPATTPLASGPMMGPVAPRTHVRTHAPVPSSLPATIVAPSYVAPSHAAPAPAHARGSRPAVNAVPPPQAQPAPATQPSQSSPERNTGGDTRGRRRENLN